MLRAWIVIVLAFAFGLRSTCARVFVWGDAFIYTDFDSSTSSPFTRFRQRDFSSPPNVFASFLPELGPYGGHVWLPGKLEYNLDIPSRGFQFETVDVKLGFAEVYLPLCTDTGRIMQVSVNEQVVNSVNIFELAGCRTPHDLVFPEINASAPIKIVVEGIVENAMLSNLVVRDSRRTSSSPPSTTSPSTGTPSSGTPSTGTPSTGTPSTGAPSAGAPSTEPSRASFGKEISRRFGAFNKVLQIRPGSNGRFNRVPKTAVFRDRNALIEGTVRPNVLNTHRHGQSFTYHIRGRGTYFIQLSFAEINPIYCEGPAKRIFSVSFNGEIELDDLDVFEREGCRRAFIYTRLEYRISSNLFITFKGKEGNAMISHILVRPVQTSCTPESLADAMTSDHLAHSVPGQYPPIRSPSSPMSYVDDDGDGFERVSIDGGGSHTHFLDTVNNIAGRITTFEWTNPDTTEFISDKQAFSMNFMLGTTKLSLKVEDNICSSHTVETSVTVTDSIRTGTYCYFYPGQTSFPLPGGPDQEIKPTFSKSFPDANWDFSGLPFSSSAFAARCEMFISVAPTASRLIGSISASAASASFFRGVEAVVEDVGSSSFDIPVSASMSSFEVLYVRPPSTEPLTLSLSLEPELEAEFSYDRGTIFPVITSLSPTEAPVSGGTVASVEVIGSSLDAAEVHVADEVVPVSRRNTQTNEVFFNIPPGNSSGPVSVFLKWPEGFMSNSLTFTYLSGPAEDSIAFTEQVMRDASTNEVTKNELASSIRIGYGGDIYMGTLGARVLKLTYDPETLEVTRRCRSKPLRDDQFSRNGEIAERGILGMALDPNDIVPRPYVSTQTLFWRVRDRIDPDNLGAWRNGAIDRLKPGSDANDGSICLVFDERIVSGLPVSNHDHGVNGLEFTQSGDLIIAIGGNTNAGLPGVELGNLLETPLSGSIILAKLSLGSAFDGEITYSDDVRPNNATVQSGDIEFLARGVRNGFFPSLHSSGRLYIIDNGPNAGFGNVIGDCSEISDAVPFDSGRAEDLPGTVMIGPSGNRFSVTRPDKVLNIRLDGRSHFYGHPNPNRNECTYVEPVNNVAPNNRAIPDDYIRPLMTVTSSTNAIVEYHAGNVFNGALRGKLIISTFSNRPTSYIEPFERAEDAEGESPTEIFPRGGLSLVVNAWGDMIIPRLNENNILVLRPTVPNLERRDAVSITAVSPLRHRRQGKSIATIGGYNFGPGEASVRIGSRPCVVLSQSIRTITCETPEAATPGGLETVEVTIEGGGTATLEKAVWYTEV